MEVAKIWIGGEWSVSEAESTFQAENPATGEILPQLFPVSSWSDCETALTAAWEAATKLRSVAPERLAAFLEAYAANLEASASALIEAAHKETGLPITPRLRDVELPRTTNQLRQAAAAAREESWKRATLDTAKNIRASYAPIGPVIVFGPNNFPFAFNGISGGDFAAALAAGNPVIAKAHPLHPETTRLLAQEASKALAESGLPPGTVQLLYHIGNASGLRLVSDRRTGAVGFTGSRGAGLALKRAADEAGKPIYAEMSSINPVLLLPGALQESGQKLAGELVDSCLAGAGQFCTSPNLILLWEGEQAESFLVRVSEAFAGRNPQPLLSASGLRQIVEGVSALVGSGAVLVTGGKAIEGAGYRYANTLLRATAKQFLASPDSLQKEVFGNVTMAVTVSDAEELQQVLSLLEGNLTGTIYTAGSGADEALYATIEPLLRTRVGRLLNNKMPTGVAVSPAMHHGGPYPATSHPGFTSVGIPASLTRFAVLECYDGVPEDRLPLVLRNQIANPKTWRSIDGAWVQG